MTTTSTYPLAFVIVICIVFCLEMVAGLGMNLYNVYRWYRGYKKRMSKKLGFKNLSGNNFVITLKFLDIFICSVVIPFALIVQVLQPQYNLVPCLLKEGLIILASSSSSFGVMLVSIDRYAAVVTPLKPVMTPLRKRICRISLVLYGLTGSALPSLCFLMGSYNSGVMEGLKFKSCRHVVWNFKPFYLYDLYYITSFVIAMTTTILCYRAVLKVVRRRLEFRIVRMTKTSEAMDFSVFRRQEIRAQRVAFAVVMSFLICWGPHVSITIIQLVIPKNIEIDMIQAAGLGLAFLSPIVHSVIYSYETSETRSKLTIHGIILGFRRVKSSVRVMPQESTMTGSFRPTTSVNTVGNMQNEDETM